MNFNDQTGFTNKKVCKISHGANSRFCGLWHAGNRKSGKNILHNFLKLSINKYFCRQQKKSKINHEYRNKYKNSNNCCNKEENADLEDEDANEICVDCCEKKKKYVLLHGFRKEIDMVEYGNIQKDDNIMINEESIIMMMASAQAIKRGILDIKQELLSLDNIVGFPRPKSIDPDKIIPVTERCVTEIHNTIKSAQKLAYASWLIRSKSVFQQTLFDKLDRPGGPFDYFMNGKADVNHPSTNLPLVMQAHIENVARQGTDIICKGKGVLRYDHENVQGDVNNQNSKFNHQLPDEASVETTFHSDEILNDCSLKPIKEYESQAKIVVFPTKPSNIYPNHSKTINILDTKWLNTNNSNNYSNKRQSSSRQPTAIYQFGKSHKSLAHKLKSIEYYQITNEITDDSESRSKPFRQNLRAIKEIKSRPSGKLVRKSKSNGHSVGIMHTNNNKAMLNPPCVKNDLFITAAGNDKCVGNDSSREGLRNIYTVKNANLFQRKDDEVKEVESQSFYTCCDQLSDHGSLDGIESLAEDKKCIKSQRTTVEKSKLNKHSLNNQHRKGDVIYQETLDTKKVERKYTRSQQSNARLQNENFIKKQKYMYRNQQINQQYHQKEYCLPNDKRSTQTYGAKQTKQTYFPQDKSTAQMHQLSRECRSYGEKFANDIQNKMRETMENVNQLAIAYISIYKRLENLKLKHRSSTDKQLRVPELPAKNGTFSNDGCRVNKSKRSVRSLKAGIEDANEKTSPPIFRCHK